MGVEDFEIGCNVLTCKLLFIGEIALQSLHDRLSGGSRNPEKRWLDPGLRRDDGRVSSH